MNGGKEPGGADWTCEPTGNTARICKLSLSLSFSPKEELQLGLVQQIVQCFATILMGVGFTGASGIVSTFSPASCSSFGESGTIYFY